MQTPLYLKHGESSSQKSCNPSLRPENRLNLFPEHHAQISAAFIRHLSADKKPQTDTFEIHFPESLATELCKKSAII